MFGKVKQWLGIEGVKLELVLPEKVVQQSGRINGKIRFFSKNEQTVTTIRIVLIEKYTRGRRTEKKIDEYELGEIHLDRKLEVPAEKPIEIEFILPFALAKSDMDRMEDKNVVLGKIAKTAKWLQGVSSEYRVEAYAKVSGVALDPFDRKELVIE